MKKGLKQTLCMEMLFFYTYSGRSGLSWNYSGYSFRIEGNLSQEEILMIQSSLVKEDEDEKTNS